MGSGGKRGQVVAMALVVLSWPLAPAAAQRRQGLANAQLGRAAGATPAEARSATPGLSLSPWPAPPLAAPGPAAAEVVDGAPLAEPLISQPAANFFGPRALGRRWSLLRRAGLSTLTLIDLHEDWLVNSGNAWEFLDTWDQAPVQRLSAAVRAQRLSHERSATLALAQRFAAAQFEVGLEGLFSEPMAAQVRRGRPLMALRRAGTVFGFRVGALNQRTGVLAPRFGPPGQRAPGLGRPRVWRRAQPWQLAATMVVEGHARRWLGHGERPHLDARWRAEAAWTLAQQDGERLAQLLLRTTWRQVVGARGQVVQVGSFPLAQAGAPYVLYEPLVGFEDLARYTAHVFATELKSEVRLAPWLSAGAFASATLVDRFSREWRDAWLVAAGPTLTARLPFGPPGMTLQVQSARRAGNEHDRWLHLATLGV